MGSDEQGPRLRPGGTYIEWTRAHQYAPASLEPVIFMSLSFYPAVSGINLYTRSLLST